MRTIRYGANAEKKYGFLWPYYHHAGHRSLCLVQSPIPHDSFHAQPWARLPTLPFRYETQSIPNIRAAG